MFAGNPNLRDANEAISMEPWQLLEIQKCVRDPVYFANKYVKITTKDHGIQLFKTWEFQSDLIKTMKDNRFVIAKFPRQCGKCVHINTILDVKFPDGSIEKISIGDLFELIKDNVSIVILDSDIVKSTTNHYTRKFIESYSGGGIEVLSDTGWKPIEKIHKTEVYDIWEVVTTGHSLKCADDHILFTNSENGLEEVFAKDLHIGDQIYTDTGWESVVDVYNTDKSDNMYDIELDDENHRYYTNGIVSHNSTTTRAFLLWQALFTRDITIAILANKLSLAMEQLQQLKESYAMLPYWMQPGLRQWNKKTVQFSHNTRVMCAATSPDGIRGLAVNILYIDEFAFIPHYIADEFIASIFPTISSGKSTKIFITSCVPKNTMVFTDGGIREIGDFVLHEDTLAGVGYEIGDYNVVGYRDKLNHGTIMHNEGIRDTRIISTPYTEVECTHTHKWWSCIDGKYDWVKSSDLSVGDYVSVKYGMNCWGDDIIDFIDPTPTHKNSNRVGDIKTMTPDLAYLIGLYISEGCISDVSGNRSLTITCGDDLTPYLNTMNLRYNIEADGLHYKISSASLVSMFTYLGFDVNRKAPTKIIPPRLMRLSKSCTSAMIQGIFDGDGCAHKSKQKVAIGLSSKRLIEQLRVLFLNYGILSSYYYVHQKPTKKVKVWSHNYRLEITKSESLQVYKDYIGFRFTRKQTILDSYKLEPSRSGSRTDVIPYSYTSIRELKKTRHPMRHILFNSGEHKDWLHCSRAKMLEYKSELGDVSPAFENTHSNIIWCKITNIEESTNYVCDFSLDDIDGDNFCHSVVYNGAIGLQTPKGMNQFYTMWEGAMKGPNHKDWNKFIPKEIPWNAVPDRDEEWAKTQIRQIGQIRFNQEFLCIGYAETITIRNTNADSVSVVKIGDLHTRFAFGGRIAYVDALEILTPTGYKPFVGIVSRDPQPGIQLTLSDNSIFTCANKHRILTESGFTPAIDTLDKTILGRDAHVSSISDIGSTIFYDIIEVDDHEFISSGLISHNCDFVGSVSTLIDNNFLKTMKPVDPLELPNLPEFIKIWEVPNSRELVEQKGWEYIACLDASYGVRADSSVLKIYKAKSNINLHLVAQMSANDMEIDEFCECAYQLLNKYNQPNLIIEMNGPGTAAMEYFHIKAEYENLVHFDPRGKMKGLWAGDKLKNAAVIMLKSYVQRKLVKDNDSDTIAELFSFGKVTKEKWGAMGGNHDDHVMCMLWCIYYVNSPLFYGNIVEANIAGMKNPDLALETDDSLVDEEVAFSTMKNPEFHKKELEDAAKYNPYERDMDGEDSSQPTRQIRIIGEEEYDDDDGYVGGFRA